jgi:hypothetical protein
VAIWAYDGSERFDEPIYWPSFEVGFIFLLDKLEDRFSAIAELKNQFVVRFWCGHFQFGPDGGPTLSPNLLERLAAAGIEVFIDTHFVTEKDRGGLVPTDSLLNSEGV